MTTFAVATAHSLVLTVSHDLLFRQPLIYVGTDAAVSLSKVSYWFRFNLTHESGQSS
jgi:hypothetical protein